MTTDLHTRMKRAVRAVRREGRKAAALHAAAEAVAVLLAVNLGLAAAGSSLPGALSRPVPLPTAGVAGLADSVEVGALVAVGAGAVTAVVAYWLRFRHPAVERFESINPPVAEALRTARDALESDREGPMTDRLYASVLDRLRECSSLGLIGVRRLAVTLVLIALLGAANVQVAVVDVGFGIGGGGKANAAGGPGAGSGDYAGLQNPDQVLGDPENVSSGSEEVNATLPSRGGKNGSPSSESYSTSGFAASGDVESQQAGFAEQERLEDAELIRKYNLRIREEDDS
ncbi:MAG: hypothetical protein ABEJ81_06800 [Haloferacaceae archaeon]